MGEMVYHYNTWWWGKSVNIIACGGHGICEVQFDSMFPEVAFVRDLSVTEEMRGQGVAKMLLQECERFAVNNGCKVIQLDAERGGWCAEWYKRLGFVVTKKRKQVFEMKKTIQ